MKKTKWLIVVLVIAIAVVAFAGCNKDEGPAKLEGDGDIVWDENGNVVYDNVNLKMWSVTTGDDANTQDRIVAEFNSLYEGMIHVTVEHYSRYDLETLLSNTMQFDKKNAPDILFNHGSKTTEYNERGWLQEVDFFFDKSGASFDKDDYVDSLLESVTIDGTAYGVPIDVHSAVICIRTDILEKNNLPIPTTYEELCEVADAAAELAANNNLWIRGENSEGYSATEWRLASTAEPYTAFPISYGDMWVHEFVDYTAAVQNGGAIVDAEGMPAWDTQATADGLQVLRDWIFPSSSSANEHALSQDYGSSYDVGDAPFNSGKCIFKLQGPWAWQKEVQTFDQMLAKDGGSANITTRSLSGMFAKDSDAEYSSLIKGEGHAITLMSTVTSYTKAAAATVFMEYMANYSGIEWAKRGHLPAVISVSQSAEYTNDPAYEQYIKYWGTPEDYVVVPPTKYYSYVDTYFKNAAQKAIANSYKNQSIKSILDEEYKSCIDYIQLYS